MASVPFWEFQETGFFTRPFQSGFPDRVETALTLRSGLAWPVIHAPDQQNAGLLRSYSLFSASNPNVQLSNGDASNWFEFGSPIDISQQAFGNNTPRLRGASSAQGSFGVAVTDYDPPSFGGNGSSLTVLGSSLSGPNATLSGVGAFDFDAAGNVVTAAVATPPGEQSDTIIDLSISMSGEVGAVVIDPSSRDIRLWQNFPVIGWANTVFQNGGPGFTEFDPASIDLQYNSSPQATPHLGGVDQFTGELVVYDFNARTADWDRTVLDISAETGSQIIRGVTLADNGSGIVGAAWVNGEQLKYAYRDTTLVNPFWITTTVNVPTDPFSNGEEIQPQSVGLAFDFNGLPMISFVRNGDSFGEILLAYDPPSPSIDGDFNGDGEVNTADFTVWRDGFATGDFTLGDYQAWKANFGASVFGASATASAAGAIVPEPGALCLLLFGTGAAAGQRRRIVS